MADPARNPWFACNIVNRVWCWLLGRGIIHEPDDIRPDNPPENPALLAWLQQELVAAHYDLKHVYRLILNSKTYQLSSIPQTDNPQAETHFACYPVRRLEAEVLIDAFNQITGTTERYSSAIPEPFTFIPENASHDRPGRRQYQQPLLGHVRPSVARHRPGIEAQQSSHRGTDVALAEIPRTSIGRYRRAGTARDRPIRKESAEMAEGYYLAILSRLPSEDELKIVESYSKSGVARTGKVPVDLGWALINSAEFLHRH